MFLVNLNYYINIFAIIFVVLKFALAFIHSFSKYLLETTVFQKLCCWVNSNTVVNKADSSLLSWHIGETVLNEETNTFLIAHFGIRIIKEKLQCCETGQERTLTGW